MTKGFSAAEGITLVTDRGSFVPRWRAAFEAAGFDIDICAPEDFASVGVRSGVVFDGESASLGEDELLTAVGFAKAMGACVCAQLTSVGRHAEVEDLLEEMCAGLISRSGDEIERVAASLMRRIDDGRRVRFEFLTLSPRGDDLLAILGDGESVIVKRPIEEGDDRSEVVEISFNGDATAATLELASGVFLELSAARVAPKTIDSIEEIPLDGERVGARLRQLRLDAGLTQAELARRTGIHRPNIARVEAGRHTPSLETLARIASAIGVPTMRVLADS